MRKGTTALTPVLISFLSITAFLAVMWFAMMEDTPDGNSNTVSNANITANTDVSDVNDDRTLVTNSSVNTNTTSNTNTETDLTAGWETYTNTIHGYSIRYPSNWPINSTSFSAVTIGTVPAEPGPGALTLNVYIDKTVAQRLSELKANYPDGCTTETSTTVSGEAGTMLQCYGAFANEPHELTLVASGSKTYELTYISGSMSTDPIMKQILSTFTFPQ